MKLLKLLLAHLFTLLILSPFAHADNYDLRGQDPSGNWRAVQVDASGNLKAAGSPAFTAVTATTVTATGLIIGSSGTYTSGAVGIGSGDGNYGLGVNGAGTQTQVISRVADTGTIGFVTNVASSVAVRATVTNAGGYTASDTITSSRATDLGWTPVAGANVACNTTCTSACVFGLNLTAGNITGSLLACTDATADVCMCAGAS